MRWFQRLSIQRKHFVLLMVTSIVSLLLATAAVVSLDWWFFRRWMGGHLEAPGAYARVAVAVLLVNLLVAFLSSVFLQRSVRRPILALLKSARAVARDRNDSLRATQTSQDEFGQLIDVFKEMLAQIEAREAAWPAAQQDLEKRVQEQTSTLRQEINERKRAEDALRECKQLYAQMEEDLRAARAKAEAASSARSRFLTKMSHEIRTPLNGIIGMTELALDIARSTEQRGLLNTVHDSALTLLRMMDEVLDFSHLEAGRLRLQTAPFRLRRCVEDTVRALAAQARQKSLALVCDVASETPDALLGDAHRLRQVLVNLVMNAIKFTDQGEVRVSVQLRSETTTEADLQFEVRDTGVGIAPEKQRVIFEAFTQGDDSSTRPYGGAGLGLAICAQLVRMMGSQLEVESVPGRGSLFRFTVRLARPQPNAPASEAPAPDFPAEQVLVVDAKADNRQVLEAALRDWGVIPVVVSDAHVALTEMRGRVLQGDSFRFVLLNADLPDMNGFELVARLRSNPHLAGAMVLIVPAGQRAAAIERSKDSGIRAYLTEPICLAELKKLLTTLLDRPALRSFESSPATATDFEPRRALRVLLAEDNVVNQRLSITLLESWGHEVHLACNGREALEMLERQVFDLVLLDLQMPEVSGWEVLAAWREQESQRGGHLPVIALTADALIGNDEASRATGLDALLPKPVDRQRLFATIESLTAPGSEADQASSDVSIPFPPVRDLSPDAARADAIVNMDGLLARVGGDLNLLREIISLFLQESTQLLERVRQAVEQRDAEALFRAAHGLKGASSTFALPEALAPMLSLESAGKNDDFSHSAALYQQCEEQTMRLCAALRELACQQAA